MTERRRHRGKDKPAEISNEQIRQHTQPEVLVAGHGVTDPNSRTGGHTVGEPETHFVILDRQGRAHTIERRLTKEAIDLLDQTRDRVVGSRRFAVSSGQILDELRGHEASQPDRDNYDPTKPL